MSATVTNKQQSASRSKAIEMVKAIKTDVEKLLAAMVVAKFERERVDAKSRDILASQIFHGTRYVDRKTTEKFRVTDPSDTWMMEESSFEKYHSIMQGWHIENGFKDAEDGKCPALVAEHNKIKAEWALIKSAERFAPGVTNDKLLCGTKDKCGLDLRREYIDLLIGMVVNCSDDLTD